MDDRERRGREIQNRIGRILYEDWDPLGLRDIAPSDEYDSYVGRVYRLLASDATCEEVAEHLAKLESDSLGYSDAPASTFMLSGGEAGYAVADVWPRVIRPVRRYAARPNGWLRTSSE